MVNCKLNLGDVFRKVFFGILVTAWNVRALSHTMVIKNGDFSMGK
jgi:hypothetical protein